MSVKPGDFFLGVIEFFGVLVPGAVFVFLDGRRLLGWIGTDRLDGAGEAGWWVGFLVAAYLFGSVPFGIGILVQSGVEWVVRKLRGAKSNSDPDFHRAYSYARLKSAVAVAEIDRHAAMYKLSRTLAVVFLADAALTLGTAPAGEVPWPRFWTAVALFVLCVIQTAVMVHWTRQHAFNFHDLLKEEPPASSPGK